MTVRIYKKATFGREFKQSVDIKILPNVGDSIVLNSAFTNPLIVVSRIFHITNVGNLDLIEIYVEETKNENNSSLQP